MPNNFLANLGRGRRNRRDKAKQAAAGTDPTSVTAASQALAPPALAPDKPLFNTDAAQQLTVTLQLKDRYALLADRLKRDLLRLVAPENTQAGINLIDMLHLERGRYPRKQEYLAQLISDDVTIFVRERMVSAIKLLFFDNTPQDGQYLVRLQIEYPYTRIDDEAEQESGNPTGPAPDPMTAARAFLDTEHYRLAIVAQWWPAIARDKTSQIRRHIYFFDWVASEKFLSLAAPTPAEAAAEDPRYSVAAPIAPDVYVSPLASLPGIDTI